MAEDKNDCGHLNPDCPVDFTGPKNFGAAPPRDPEWQSLDCAWCGSEIYLDPAEGTVWCEDCGNLNEIWADGDIGPEPTYYLARKST